MVHTYHDHKENRPRGWHTFDLDLARIGIAVSRRIVFTNSLSCGCVLPQQSNGV